MTDWMLIEPKVALLHEHVTVWLWKRRFLLKLDTMMKDNQINSSKTIMPQNSKDRAWLCASCIYHCRMKPLVNNYHTQSA